MTKEFNQSIQQKHCANIIRHDLRGKNEKIKYNNIKTQLKKMINHDDATEENIKNIIKTDHKFFINHTKYL